MHTVLDNIVNADVLKTFLVLRFISAGVSIVGIIGFLIGFLASLSNIALATIFLFFLMVSVIAFANEATTLPINIFYMVTLSNEDTDYTNKWLQFIAFASPIITLLVIVGGSTFENIFAYFIASDADTQNNSSALSVFLGSAPQLFQLVIATMYAFYAHDAAQPSV